MLRMLSKLEGQYVREMVCVASKSVISLGITERNIKYTDLMPDGRSRPVYMGDGDQLVSHIPMPRESIEATRVLKIRGLAWSGRGRIKAVDVLSLDDESTGCDVQSLVNW